MILDAVLIVMAVAVIVISIILHFEIKRRFENTGSECRLPQTEMFRAAHGAMVLSTAYLLAELKVIIESYGSPIPSTDATIFGAIEFGFLFYILWCCNVARKMIKNRLYGCRLGS